MYDYWNCTHLCRNITFLDTGVFGEAGERLKVVETVRTVEYEYDKLYRLVKEIVTAADTAERLYNLI